MIRYACILGVIATIAAFVMAFVYDITKESIDMEMRKDFLASLLVVLPEGFDNEPDQDTVEINGVNVYVARKNTDIIGHAVQVSSMKGYSGEISVMVGFTKGTIYAVTIVSHSETPGLGDKITNPYWLAQFKGAPSDEVFRVKPDGGNIDGFSGATISPRAVTEAVTKAQAIYKEILERGLI